MAGISLGEVVQHRPATEIIRMRWVGQHHKLVVSLFEKKAGKNISPIFGLSLTPPISFHLAGNRQSLANVQTLGGRVYLTMVYNLPASSGKVSFQLLEGKVVSCLRMRGAALVCKQQRIPILADRVEEYARVLDVLKQTLANNLVEISDVRKL